MALDLEFQDTQWPFTYIDHDREIVRAIVFDAEGWFYFVKSVRDDDFGPAELIETAGGGVEPGESLPEALRRELREELGIQAEIVCPLGVVCDRYNLLHRRNINRYFLCRALSFGPRSLTEMERAQLHLTVAKLRPEEALGEYRLRAETKLGTLIAQREVPVLRRAMDLLARINPV